MERLEVSSAVRPIYGSLGVKRLRGSAQMRAATFLPMRSALTANQSNNLPHTVLVYCKSNQS